MVWQGSDVRERGSSGQKEHATRGEMKQRPRIAALVCEPPPQWSSFSCVITHATHHRIRTTLPASKPPEPSNRVAKDQPQPAKHKRRQGTVMITALRSCAGGQTGLQDHKNARPKTASTSFFAGWPPSPRDTEQMVGNY